MNKTIYSNELMPLILEYVANGNQVAFLPSGSSMRPMLDGENDTVILENKPQIIKKYDVVLYKRRSQNRILLHRVVSQNVDGTYKISGDNQYFFDNSVSYDDVFAVVTAYTKSGKMRKTSGLFYCFYSRYIVLKKHLVIGISKLIHKDKH